MQCPRCGHESGADTRFCGACGEPLRPYTTLGATALLAPDDAAPAGATALLVVGLPGQPPRTFPLTKPTTTIGAGSDRDIVIDAPEFAGFQAVVLAQYGGYLLRDTTPRPTGEKGLAVDGQRTTEARLDPRVKVFAPSPNGKALSFALRPLAYGVPLGARLGTADEPLGIGFPPDGDTLTFGRDPTNDVVVDHPLASRFHARLERLAEYVVIHDLHSTNGVFVAGKRVRGLQELAVGDEVQIGPVRFVWQGTSLAPLDEGPRVRIDAVDVTRAVGARSRRKTLLDAVSLTIYPQEFVALVGGSGAGKSTLMHALFGSQPVQGGRVLYNGQDLQRTASLYAGTVGYVPQDDILHRELSVERALDYAARLRLPPDTSTAERKRRIDAVLADVQMEPQRRQPIARLSGGQRKRVSIAVELLANPSVIFLDEPTSGLDPGLDRTVMGLLRDLCAKGRTVVLVTHATENIGLCDMVAFLAGGRLVYYGPPADATDFFGVATFPDIYAMFNADPGQVSRQDLRFRQSAAFRAHVLGRQIGRRSEAEAPPAQSQRTRQQLRAAAFRQWRILSARYAELVRRDWVNLALLLAQTPIVAVALTLVTSRELYTATKINNTQQVLLMLAIATLWFGTTNAAREIVKERAIYVRERLVNLRLLPYILSKLGVLAFLGVLQVIALFWIVSLKTPHLPVDGIITRAAPEMAITLALTMLAGIAGGLLISSVVRSTDRAMSIVPIALIPQVIFSGAVFDLDGAAKWLSYLTISHWSLAAMGSTVKINEMAGRVPVNGTVQTVNRPAGTSLPDVIANWPKEMYASPDRTHLLGYWGALLLFTILFLAASFVALRRGDIRRGEREIAPRTWLFILLPPLLLCLGALLLATLRG